MNKIAKFIVKNQFILFGIIIICLIASIIFIPKVTVNYDFIKYIPDDSDSLKAYEKMESEFQITGTASIMVENITLPQVQILINELESISGVNSVSFNEQTGYKDNFALLRVYLSKNNYDPEIKQSIQDIRTCLDASGYTTYMSGEAVSSLYLREQLSSVMLTIMLIAVGIILIILFIASTSWIEPLIYLLVFGVAIIINMGTNALLPSISFITQAICAIIQLALSLDYSIMLINRFKEEQQKTSDNKQAMIAALKTTISPVSASGLTTIAGLLALVFMQFTLGLDIGLVLSKGIFISLLTVFMFMPSLVLLMSPLINKTKHKSFATKISEIMNKKSARRQIKKQSKTKHSFAQFQYKTRFVVPIILVILIAVGFVLQLNTQYSYSLSVAKDPKAQVNIENNKIVEVFGIQNSIVVLVPKGDYKKEKDLLEYLSNDIVVDGEKMLTNGQGIVSTGAYELYDAQRLSDDFALPLNLVQEIYSLMNNYQQIYLTPSGQRYLFDIINFVYTGNIAANYGAAKQDEIDSQYNLGMSLKEKINQQQAKVIFGIPDIIVAMMFVQSDTITMYQAIEFMSVNKIAMTIGLADKQAEIDFQYAQASQLMEQITIAQACEIFSINYTTAGAMFNGKTSISMLEALAFMSQQKIALVTAQTIQQQISVIYLNMQTAKTAFESDNYSRLIFNLNTNATSTQAFETVELLRNKVTEFYFDSYIVSESSSMYDIMKSFTSDTLKINLISFFAVFIVIMFMFKSASIPVLLTTLIQGAIFVTMGINTAFGSPIYFICYLVVMCIQMGATVDYAILLTSRYKEMRLYNNKIDSIKYAFRASLPTILTSGSILVLSSFIVGVVSSISVISALGFLLAQGGAISLLLITFALPQVLLLCDKLIRKTSIGFKTEKDD